MDCQIICAGQALIDCIFSGGDELSGLVGSISLSPGGDAFNEAVGISRLGRRVSLYCGLGRDAAGRLLMDSAQKSGVDISMAVLNSEHPTPVSALFVDGEGGRRSVLSGAHSVPFFTPTLSGLSGLRVATMASLFRPPFDEPARVLAFAKSARAAGAEVYADVKLPKAREMRLSDFAAALPFIDYISPNEDEARYYTGLSEPRDMARAFLDAGVGTVLLKLGRRGCLVMDRQGFFHVPAYDVQVVDGIGAGDAFAAGFITGLAEGMDLRSRCELAAAAAAICVGSAGAVSGAPDRAQAERWLSSPPVKRLPELSF